MIFCIVHTTFLRGEIIFMKSTSEICTAKATTRARLTTLKIWKNQARSIILLRKGQDISMTHILSKIIKNREMLTIVSLMQLNHTILIKEIWIPSTILSVTKIINFQSEANQLFSKRRGFYIEMGIYRQVLRDLYHKIQIRFE